MNVVNSAIKPTVISSGKRTGIDEKCLHIYLQDKKLKNIPKCNKSKDVLVLYLYGNNISKIGNLNGFSNLTSLYLQDNKIKKIENLEKLMKLKKLYIGHNAISVLEGLDNLNNLEELHIEKQRLPDGICLCADPRTIVAMSETLQILNISHNNISSLYSLSALRNLRVINASHNDLDDIKDVCESVQNWVYLKEATFAGNPIARRHHYREDIIANSYCLENLDGKGISDITRVFIRRFVEEKLTNGSKQNVNLADTIEGLPKNYPTALQKAVSASILKRPIISKFSEDLSTFDEQNAEYLAWNALPKRRPYVKSSQQKKKS